VYHVHAEQENVGDVSEVSSQKLKPKILIPVHAVFETLGPTATEMLPAIDAVSGYDSTSSLFGHGNWQKECAEEVDRYT